MFFDEAQTAKINKFFKSEKRPEVGKFGPNSKTGAVHTTRPYPGLVIRRVPIRYTFYTRGDDAARVSSDGVQTCNVLIRRAHKSLESTRPGKRKRKKIKHINKFYPRAFSRCIHRSTYPLSVSFIVANNVLPV